MDTWARSPWKAVRGSCGRWNSTGYTLQIVDPIHFQHHVAGRIYSKRRNELRSPHDVLVTVGVAGVDYLAEGVVKAFDQDEQLGFHAREVLGGLVIERTVFVDRVHDGPGKREEVYGRPFQGQGCVF